jgi:regulator of ribonuclease activity A
VVADADGVIMLPLGLTAADIPVTDVVAATALYGKGLGAA